MESTDDNHSNDAASITSSIDDAAGLTYSTDDAASLTSSIDGQSEDVPDILFAPILQVDVAHRAAEASLRPELITVTFAPIVPGSSLTWPSDSEDNETEDEEEGQEDKGEDGGNKHKGDYEGDHEDDYEEEDDEEDEEDHEEDHEKSDTFSRASSIFPGYNRQQPYQMALKSSVGRGKKSCSVIDLTGDLTDDEGTSSEPPKPAASHSDLVSDLPRGKHSHINRSLYPLGLPPSFTSSKQGFKPKTTHSKVYLNLNDNDDNNNDDDDDNKSLSVQQSETTISSREKLSINFILNPPLPVAPTRPSTIGATPQSIPSSSFFSPRVGTFVIKDFRAKLQATNNAGLSASLLEAPRGTWVQPNKSLDGTGSRYKAGAPGSVATDSYPDSDSDNNDVLANFTLFRKQQKRKLAEQNTQHGLGTSDTMSTAQSSRGLVSGYSVCRPTNPVTASASTADHFQASQAEEFDEGPSIKLEHETNHASYKRRKIEDTDNITMGQRPQTRQNTGNYDEN